MEDPNKMPADAGELSHVADPSGKEGKFRFNFDKHFLPLSILIAAVLISGSVLFANGKLGGKGGAPIVGNNGPQQKPGALVKVMINADDHTLGNKDAPVTVVEFADFRCPFCERFFQQTESQILKDYVSTGKARYIFKHYAFLGQQSTWASEAAECAAEQGKFWEYHNWLFSNQASESDLAYYSKANLIKYAGKVGLDTNQFSSCLNADKYAKRVADDMAEGQKDGVTGTPTVFINGQMIVGAQPYPVFKAAIDAALQKK